MTLGCGGPIQQAVPAGNDGYLELIVELKALDVAHSVRVLHVPLRFVQTLLARCHGETLFSRCEREGGREGERESERERERERERVPAPQVMAHILASVDINP